MIGIEKLFNLVTGFIKTFDDFRVTDLKLKFLNPHTREEAIEKRHLIQLYPSLLNNDPSDSRVLIPSRDDIQVSRIS